MTIRHLIRKLIIPRMMAPFALLSVMHAPIGHGSLASVAVAHGTESPVNRHEHVW